jgi:CRP/FNR family transcriptional regulator, cyclic AMP receptor protein
MRRRRFKRGEVLFHEGDPGDTLHLIEKGHVAIRSTTPLGDVATFAVLGPGDVFGDQALLTSSAKRTASAVALEGAETRSLTRDGFEQLRREEPATDRFLVEVLAGQVRRLSAHLLDALYVPAETRIMRRLVELAESFAQADGACVIPLTQDDLASITGVSRPTANRLLKAAEADGVLVVGRARVEILDRAELARRAR